MGTWALRGFTTPMMLSFALLCCGLLLLLPWTIMPELSFTAPCSCPWSQKKAYNYTAIIIEPREHPAFDFVVGNFAKNLDDNWQIIIFHGKDNVNFTQTIANKYSTNGRIKLVNLNLPALFRHSEYDSLMYSSVFYNLIPTEIFLVFQTDSLINPRGKQLLARFLQYDYVGGPWRNMPGMTNDGLGNGGLSLRRKSKVLEILAKCPLIGVHEDQYFSHPCKGVAYKLPSIDQAMHFSAITDYRPPIWGTHKPWWWIRELNPEQYKQLELDIPDVTTLRHIHKNETSSL